MGTLSLFILPFLTLFFSVNANGHTNTCFLSPFQFPVQPVVQNPPNTIYQPSPAIQRITREESHSFLLSPVSQQSQLPDSFDKDRVDSSIAQFREVSHNHIKGGSGRGFTSTNPPLKSSPTTTIATSTTIVTTPTTTATTPTTTVTTPTTTATTPTPPIKQHGDRPIVKRPASRFRKGDFQRLLQTHDIFTPPEPLVNKAELESIAQFESALEEAKRHGHYGLRTGYRPRTTPYPPIPTRKRQFFSNGIPQSSARSTDLVVDGLRDFRESFGYSTPIGTSVTRHFEFQPTVTPIPPSQPPTLPPPPPALPPPPATIIRNPPAKQSSNTVDDDDGFGHPHSVGHIPFSHSPTSSVSKFYSWLDNQQLITNMRISPGVNFTVLLPNDQAMDLLPASLVEMLEQNGTRMRELLFYHIIPGSINISDLINEDMIPTLLSKKDIRVAKGDSLTMSGGKIIGERTELTLDFGKIRFFEVDRVLFPPLGSLFEVISKAPGLTTFRRLIEATGLRTNLEAPLTSQSNGLTILAPTDDAFNHLSDEAARLLTRDQSVARSLVLNHFSRPVVFTSILPVGWSSTVKSIGTGLDLSITREADDLVKVNDITVIFADIMATNGILHVIDHVLI